MKKTKTECEYNEYQEMKKAFRDAMVYGQGNLRITNNGFMKHVPFKKVAKRAKKP